MNSNDLLNVQNVRTSNLYVNGQLVTASAVEVAGQQVYTATATAGQTLFTGVNPYTQGISALSVYINGVYQDNSAYSETSTTSITFSSGLDAGDYVVIISHPDQTVNVANASAVPYTPAGTGAVVTDVQTQLRATAKTVDTISDLLSESEAGSVYVNGYHTAGDGGGGDWYWKADEPTGNHNGGTIVATNVTFPSDWTNQTQVANWFTPIAGSTGCWMRLGNDPLSVKCVGAKGDGVQDDSLAIRQTADIQAVDGGEVFFPAGDYLCSTKIYDQDPVPSGVSFVGSGRGVRTVEGSTKIIWGGTGYLFDWLEPNGTTSKGGIVIKDIHFKATAADSGMFSINDPDNVDPTDDNTTPNYVRGISFQNVFLNGNDSSTAIANAIQAAKTFELTLDEQCEVSDWKRGIWLKGCDNCDIAGRYVLNCRHLQSERSGTFGNALNVTARFFGLPQTAGIEDAYHVYSTSWEEVFINNFFESGSKGMLYLDGRLQSVYDPWLGLSIASPPNNVVLKIGPNCAQAKIYNPKTTNASVGALDIADPVSWDWTVSGVQDYSVKIYDPAPQLLTDVSGFNHSRLRLIDSAPSSAQNLPFRHDGITVCQTGVCMDRILLTPWTFEKADYAFGVKGEASLVADSDAPHGYAIQLSTTDLANAGLDFVVGNQIPTGGTIVIKLWYKMGGTRTTGTNRYIIQKNSSNVTNSAITDSTSYTYFSASYTLSGFVDTDTLNVRIYNSAGDVTMNIAALEVSIARAPVYTETNVTTNRTYDANSTSTTELADVLGTLIADLRDQGIVG